MFCFGIKKKMSYKISSGNLEMRYLNCRNHSLTVCFRFLGALRFIWKSS